jgi:hypothetical protein
MASRLALCVLAAVAVGALAPAAAAQAPNLTIRVADERIDAIGDFSTRPNTRGPYAKLSSAIRAFGRPTSRRKRSRGTGCLVRWEQLGLRIEFVNLGGFPRGKSACSERWGYAQSAAVSAGAGVPWQMDRGLTLGAPLAQLQQLYPEASEENGAWWLVTGTSQIACGEPGGCPYAVASAEVDGDVVTRLRLWIGAAGE